MHVYFNICLTAFLVHLIQFIQYAVVLLIRVSRSLIHNLGTRSSWCSPLCLHANHQKSDHLLFSVDNNLLSALNPCHHCRCIIRFPSTQIKLAFTSLLEDMGPPQLMPQPLYPLKVDTTLTSPFVSPMPSPTGTIRSIVKAVFCVHLLY